LLTEDILVVAPGLDATESWRRIFVDQLREFFNVEPAFKSNVFFNNSDTSLEVTTLSSGDAYFITNLKEATSNIEERTGLVGDIRHIGGVEYSMQEDFEPPQFFLHDAYDHRDAYDQWYSQQPEGYQTVFQLQAQFQKRKGYKQVMLTRAKVKELLGKALVATGIETTPEEFADLGDGSAIVATWSGGNVIVLWDGRDFIGINLFLYQENVEFASSFKDEFIGGNVKLALRDEMPRGHGRVVNFKKDLEPRLDPIWAVGLE
jgi:hypothetical protein